MPRFNFRRVRNLKAGVQVVAFDGHAEMFGDNLLAVVHQHFGHAGVRPGAEGYGHRFGLGAAAVLHGGRGYREVQPRVLPLIALDAHERATVTHGSDAVEILSGHRGTMHPRSEFLTCHVWNLLPTARLVC